MNHFAYFTEIEERFQRRRGSILFLSTLDWALIETWREAGVPLEAVLRGIDTAFDKHESQRARLGPRRQRKVNGLAWCAQAVMEAAQQASEASVGMTTAEAEGKGTRESGFEAARIARFLTRNAALLSAAAPTLPAPAAAAAAETAARLRALAEELSSRTLSERSEPKGEGSASLDRQPPHPLEGIALSLEYPGVALEDLDRTLTVLEDKLFAALLAAAPEAELVALRAQADRELAPYRGKMGAVQIKQVQQQFLLKRLLEANSLPRLSLFYMPHEEDPA